MKIISFTVYELLNGAHVDYYFTLIQQARKCEAIVANLKAELEALEAAYEVEDEIMLRIRKNELTDKIEAQDSLRDRLLSIITYIAKMSRELPGEGVAEAAKTLVSVLGAYGNLQAMQYDRETGMIRNLCQDLQGRYSQQVATLKLTEAVENLRAANEEFNQLIVSRDESNAGFLKNEMAAARKDTDSAYYQFVDVANSLSILAERADGAAANPYRAFIEWLNAYIERLKREALKQRVTAESAEPTAPEEPGVENPGDGNDPDYPTTPGGSTGGGSGANGGGSTGGSGSNGGSTGGGGGSTGGSGSNGGGSTGGGSTPTETPTDQTKILLLFNDGAHGNVIVKRMEVAPGYQLQASDLPDGYVYAFKSDDQADIDAASPGEAVWVTLAPRD